jgi:hypothetical protein
MLLFSAPKLLSLAIDFSLGNLSGLDQRCDARVRQSVSMLAHANLKTLRLQPPLMTEFSIVICTVLHIFVAAAGDETLPIRKAMAIGTST